MRGFGNMGGMGNMGNMLKQAQKEEELLSRALEKARTEFEQASGAERARYEAQFRELDAKLREAEEKNNNQE